MSKIIFQAFGVGQHHDGISGTEKQAVVDDYTKQIYKGRKGIPKLSFESIHFKNLRLQLFGGIHIS